MLSVNNTHNLDTSPLVATGAALVLLLGAVVLFTKWLANAFKAGSNELFSCFAGGLLAGVSVGITFASVIMGVAKKPFSGTARAIGAVVAGAVDVISTITAQISPEDSEYATCTKE